MAGQPAFTPYYEVLKEHGRAMHISEIARIKGVKPESVSNSFGNHIRNCEAQGITPAVVRAQRGMFALNTSNKPAPPKHHTKPQVKPDPEPSRLFEYVGTLKDGALLARGEDGKLYRLEEA